MSSSGLFFAYSNETCTVFKRAALDVLLAQSYVVFFPPIFLLTAFSASLGAGRMILRNRFDFYCINLACRDNTKKKQRLFSNHSWTSELVVIGRKIEICSIFYILCFFMCTSTEKLECIIIVGYNKHYIVDCFSLCSYSSKPSSASKGRKFTFHFIFIHWTLCCTSHVYIVYYMLFILYWFFLYIICLHKCSLIQQCSYVNISKSKNIFYFSVCLKW